MSTSTSARASRCCCRLGRSGNCAASVCRNVHVARPSSALLCAECGTGTAAGAGAAASEAEDTEAVEGGKADDEGEGDGAGKEAAVEEEAGCTREECSGDVMDASGASTADAPACCFGLPHGAAHRVRVGLPAALALAAAPPALSSAPEHRLATALPLL